MSFTLKKALRHPFVRAGMPFLLFMGGGFWALQRFVEGKRELEDLSRGKRTLTTRQYDLEEDWKKTMKKLNTDFQLVEIPRPKDE